MSFVNAPARNMTTAEQRLAWANELLARTRTRVTPVRKEVLVLLAARPMPITLEAIARAPGLRGRFDHATLYRTLMLFLDLGLVRQFFLQNRASYFALNAPGERFNFLVCRCCGVLTALPPLEEAHQLERQLQAQHHYAALQHEVLVSGLCPVCQVSPHTCVSKLMPRRPKPAGSFRAGSGNG